MKESWKKIRYRLEWLGVLLLAKCVPLLPRLVCARFSEALGTLAYYMDRRGRAVSLSNLELALGNQCSPEERKRIARGSYQTFVRSMMDLFWSSRLTPQNYSRYIHLEGVEHFLERHRQKSGAIFIMTHLGNFEWTHMSVAFYGYPGWGVAENFKNPLLDDIFRRLRGVAGNNVLDQEHSMVRLLKQVKRGGIAGMLIDLNLSPDQPSVILESFGMKTCATFLHALLQQRTGAPVFPIHAIPLKDGTQRVIVHAPLEFSPEASVAEIAQVCWNFFEPKIRENPHLWMWAYKHWRYKPANTNRPYPFYAHVSRKFEKLLERSSPKQAVVIS